MHDHGTDPQIDPAEVPRRSGLERVAHLLSGLNDRLGMEAVGESSFDLLLSMAQIGKALGLTPIHVAVELKRLRTEGVIALAGRTITVRDAPRLRKLASLAARDT